MKNLLCKTDCHGKCAQWGILILRIVVGAVFIYHGWGKLTDAPGIAGFSGMLGGMMGLPMPTLLAWVVALTEFLGGIALVLGIFVKPASYLLAFVMIVALSMVKKFDIFGKGEIDFVLLGATLALAMLGSGKYSTAVMVCGCCKNEKCDAGCGTGTCEMKK